MQNLVKISKITGLRQDIIAGFNVFLLALPLCLGIATASHFPPVAGILTAIVGGILAGCLGGAELSIKGPAAGLIVIVLGAVYQLGGGDLQLGYERTLAVGVVAALVQILFAWMRKAVIAEIMPPSVIHGMLAAIGVIIVSKQSYVMMGVTPSASTPLGLLAHIPLEIFHLNPIIFALGLLAFLIVIFWPKIKKLAFIPSSIVILAIVLPLSLFLNLEGEHTYSFIGNEYSLGPEFLINLPLQFFKAIQFPDFSDIFSLLSLKYIIMFSLVGSIESLLTVCAIDSIAPKLKPSDLNRDLFATGVGNLVSALIGGLPMISEIVRSKANIDYGATSRWANFSHGFFMLIAVLLLPSLMNLIPLSVLAALLVFVGIKLASPKAFIHAYRIGRDQFLLFLTTFIVTLLTDLLIGVLSGILLKIIFHIARGNNLKTLFKPSIIVTQLKDDARIQIEGPLTFLSYLSLKNTITKLSKEANHITISLQAVTYLDHTVMNKFQTLSRSFPGVTLILEDNSELAPFSPHPLSSRGR